MSEKFDPFNPRIKGVNDIPESEKEQYANLPDGGFVKKEVIENEERFQADAKRRNGRPLLSVEAGEELPRRQILSAADVAHEEGLMIDRRRHRTVEDVEHFDINEDGLATHGTWFSRLENILTNGLGPVATSDQKVEVDFNIVGTEGVENKDPIKVGFGPDRVRYGGQCVFVTDIFKKLWPNWINTIVKRGVGDSSWPQLDVEVRTRESGTSNPYGEKILEVSDSQGWFGRERNSEGLEILPQPEKQIIPQAAPERKIEGYLTEPGEFSKAHKVPAKYAGGEHTDADAMAKQLLGHWAFNAIVIPKEPLPQLDQIPPEEALQLIIEIQKRVLPKEEHIPVYDDTGRCLYNPLK